MAASAGIVSMVIAAGTAAYQGYTSSRDKDRAEDQLQDERKDELKLHDKRAKRIEGSQRAAFGASGVDVNAGTPLEVIDMTRQEAQEEREAIMQGYDFRSDTLKTEASRIRTGAAAKVGGTLLTGVGEYMERPGATNPFATTPTTRPMNTPWGGR